MTGGQRAGPLKYVRVLIWVAIGAQSPLSSPPAASTSVIWTWNVWVSVAWVTAILDGCVVSIVVAD